MGRKRKNPGRRPRQRARPGPEFEPEWVWIGDQRMFVVGYTSGGAPYGVFEDEMEFDEHTDGLARSGPTADDPPF